MKVEAQQHILEINGRWKREHERFLKELSTTHLPKLMSRLGIEKYKIQEVFVEPYADGIRSPDLVIFYTAAPFWNILFVEAKAHHSRVETFDKLESQLHELRAFINKDGTVNHSLYTLLQGEKGILKGIEEVPVDILECCDMRAVGVYRVGKHGFKIYERETLREIERKFD